MSTYNNLTDMITMISSSGTEGESGLKSPNQLQELAGEPEDQFEGDNQIR